MAFRRHTVGDQSPSERLCLFPNSGSLTRATNLCRESHLDFLSPFRTCGSDLVEFFNTTVWACYGRVAVLCGSNTEKDLWWPNCGE